MAPPTIAGFPTQGDAPKAGGDGVLGVRVVVRTPNVESFVQKYSRFVKEDRIFIFTKASQPIGTAMRFTLELADGKPLVSGEGTVTRVRPDTNDPSRPPGMELKFVPTDDASRKLVSLMLAEREISSAPRTGTLSAPPPPAPAQLPSLPLTGAYAPYNPPEPDEVTSSEPALPLARAAAPTKLEPPKPATTLDAPTKMEPPLASTPSVLRPPAKVQPAMLRPPGKSQLPEPSPLRDEAMKPPLDLPKRPVGKTIMGMPAPAFPPMPKPATSADEPFAALETERVDLGDSTPSSTSAVPLASHLDIQPRTDEVPLSARIDSLTAVPTLASAELQALIEEQSPRREQSSAGIEIAVSDDPPTTERSPIGLDREEAETTAVYPNGASSTLDADSLFALGDQGVSTHAPDEHAPALRMRDDASQSFPGLDAASPMFAEGWKSDESLVPANPFGEVSDNAIEYFVEWSLGRSTAPANATPSTSFDAVEMHAPAPAPDLTTTSGAAPILDGSAASKRRNTSIGLVIGLGIGLVMGGLAVTMMRRAPAPVVVVARPPETIPAKPEPPKPVAAKPEPPKPVAAKPEPPKPVAAKPVAADVSDVVAIASKPQGASITVDGTPAGTTPSSVPMPTGSHKVELKLDHYAPFSTDVTSPGKLDAVLKRPHATLHITSNPSGADVFVQGEARGKTPLSVQVTEIDGYDVEVMMPGRTAWKKRVHVKGSTMSLTATLPAARSTTLPRPADLPMGRGTGL